MTAFQSALVNMSDEEVWMTMCAVVGNLRDIVEATGGSITVSVTDGKDPIIIRDGEVDSDFTCVPEKEPNDYTIFRDFEKAIASFPEVRA